MANNPLRRNSPRYGASTTGQGYGGVVGGGFYGGDPSCPSACPAPSVIGNAGLPGCGTSRLPGTECCLKVVFKNSESVDPLGTASVEVLAGRAGAFKPCAVYMVGIGADDPSVNVRFQILDVTVMGNPQLVSYQGTTVASDRGLTDFFNLQCMPQPVDWAVFGASAGQGLIVSVRNLEPEIDAVFYIAVWGDGATCDLIGQRV